MAKVINAQSGIKGFKAETIDGVFTAKIRQMHGFSWIPWIIRGTVIAPIIAMCALLSTTVYDLIIHNSKTAERDLIAFISGPSFWTEIMLIAFIGAFFGMIIAFFRPQRFKLTIDSKYLTFRGKSYALSDIDRLRVHRHNGGDFCYVWADYGRKEMNLKVWRFFHDASRLQQLISSEIEKRKKEPVAAASEDLEVLKRAASF